MANTGLGIGVMIGAISGSSTAIAASASVTRVIVLSSSDLSSADSVLSTMVYSGLIGTNGRTVG